MKAAIRVDAYKSLGTGHLLRSLALAQGFKDSGWETVFLTYCETEKLIERVKGEGFKVYPLQEAAGIEETMAVLEKEKPEWVVLDGYHFGPDYQKAIKEVGFRLMVIDDYSHLEHYHADIILNQNYGAEGFRYSAEPHTKFLLGTEYVLLRREFLKYMGYEREIPDVAKKLLITLGGADPENNTLRVLRAANLIETRLDIKVIVGASNPHYESIRRAAEGAGHNVEVLAGVEDMAPLMAWADVAVSAGGTTVWELAFMGLPALLCIVADNQEGAVGALGRDGVFRSVGWISKLTDKELSDELAGLIYGKDLRNDIHNRARAIVDGKGTGRLLGAILMSQPEALRKDIDFGEVKFINFINLTADDKEMVRSWRNSAEIRRWMFTDHIISKGEHLHFIENLRNDDRHFYWMVRLNGKPVGVGGFQKVNVEDRSGYLGIYSMEKGAGKKIFKYLLHVWLDVRGMRVLKCEFIEGNDMAYNLYKDFGFEEKGVVRSVRKDGRDMNVILMSRVKGQGETAWR